MDWITFNTDIGNVHCTVGVAFNVSASEDITCSLQGSQERSYLSFNYFNITRRFNQYISTLHGSRYQILNATTLIYHHFLRKSTRGRNGKFCCF